MIDENGEQKEPVTYNVLKPTNEEGTQIEIDPRTDLSRGFKDIRFTTMASNGFEAGTEAALLTNMATQLKIPELVPLILKRLNIADVDKIVDQLSLVNKQAATIEQLMGTVKDLEHRTTILANQITQKSFEVSKAQFDKWFEKYKSEVKEGIPENGR